MATPLPKIISVAIFYSDKSAFVNVLCVNFVSQFSIIFMSKLLYFNMDINLNDSHHKYIWLSHMKSILLLFIFISRIEDSNMDGLRGKVANVKLDQYLNSWIQLHLFKWCYHDDTHLVNQNNAWKKFANKAWILLNVHDSPVFSNTSQLQTALTEIIPQAVFGTGFAQGPWMLDSSNLLDEKAYPAY